MGSLLTEEVLIDSFDILHIEDDPNDALLTASLLKKAASIDINLHQVDSLSSALKLAQEHAFDAIILDLNLPDASGLEAVRYIHQHYPHRAIVVMTGHDDEAQANQALLFGAQDYLVKGTCNGDTIWRSLRYAIERKRFEQRLERLANFDALTGLTNRTLCMNRLNQLVANLQRYGGMAALLFLDLDKFKWVNDNLGHEKGDLLLRAISERLTRCVRHGDIVARIGGDEFVVILEQVTRPSFVSQVATKLIDNCNLPVCIDNQDLYVGVSIGIVICDQQSQNAETILNHADLAMYQAKECGRNNFQFYTHELNVHAKSRAILANGLREAIDNNELELYYQAKVNITTNKICGAEALLRWNHPEIGLVLPNVFIPLLEETGLILSVGNWVLEQACSQFKQWYQSGLVQADDRIAVNLSGRQLIYSDLVAIITTAIDDSDLPAKMLEIELTESMLMEDTDQIKQILMSLQAIGIQVAIDDFGTGFSCLSYLKKFPINSLKIDKSFVTKVTEDAENATICSAVISLAHALGISVTAEGVENASCLDFLKQKGCEQYQGYYFNLPMNSVDFEALLLDYRKPN